MTPIITDNKVMRGLECCINYNCFQCPYDDSLECTENLNKDIFDFINRLQAENERLKYNLEAVLSERADHSEAIKEFAERLTDRADLVKVNAFDSKYAISQDDIDNLVKEMVGDTE